MCLVLNSAAGSRTKRQTTKYRNRFPPSTRIIALRLCVSTYIYTVIAMTASPAALAQAVSLKKPEGLDLYSRFALAGALGCSVTHGAFTPVDVYVFLLPIDSIPQLCFNISIVLFILHVTSSVKTKIQLDPATYNRGMIGGFRQVIRNEGAGALLTGFGPTFTGYFIQGAFKFGGYEFFKQKSIDILGIEKARQNRAAVYSISAASAEFFASIALCPLEATRIRLVSTPGFANGLVGGFSKILKNEGIGAFYSGFGPILFKQYVHLDRAIIRITQWHKS